MGLDQYKYYGKKEEKRQRQEEGLLLDCLNSLMGFYV
jgi:hypothetical protein